MTQPSYLGRPLPHNDFEGDDFTPGAGGRWVTCQDTAAGRMVSYATAGRVDVDGRLYRAALPTPDPDGVSLQQVAVAVQRVAGLVLVVPDWTLAQALAHLTAGRGLVVDGWYGALPRSLRYQAGAAFAHALWFSHKVNSQLRGWDPLNPDLTGYGRWYPLADFTRFATSLGHLVVGYVDLQPLAPAAVGEPMTNLVPMTCHRVIDLPSGTRLERTPGGGTYTLLSAASTLGVLSATPTHWQVADGDVGVYVRRDAGTVRTADLNVGK